MILPLELVQEIFIQTMCIDTCLAIKDFYCVLKVSKLLKIDLWEYCLETQNVKLAKFISINKVPFKKEMLIYKYLEHGNLIIELMVSQGFIFDTIDLRCALRNNRQDLVVYIIKHGVSIQFPELNHIMYRDNFEALELLKSNYHLEPIYADFELEQRQEFDEMLNLPARTPLSWFAGYYFDEQFYAE